MNRKQLAILVVLIAIVGGAGLLLQRQNRNSWQNPNQSLGQKLMGDFPVNDVAHILIEHGTNELNLVKTNNLWRVHERGDYPAGFSEISDFLLKVKDLKVVQSEKAGPSVLARLGLVPGEATNSALVVDFKDQGDKVIRTLLLGKKHMKKSDRPSPYGDMGMGDEGWPDGRYVKAGKDAPEVALISEAFANIEPKPEQWLNKDFFKVEKVRSIAVTFPNATNSWKLSRETETGEWKLADAKPGEQLDSAKTSGVAGALASPSFVDVAAGGKPEAFGLDKPTEATLETFDNFTYTVKVGHKTNENYPILVSVAAQLPKERTPGKDEKAEDKTKLDKEFKDNQKKLEDKLNQDKAYGAWIYLVSSWSIDSLLKERAQLMVEKKEEPKKGDKPAATEEPKKDEPAFPLPLPEPPK